MAKFNSVKHFTGTIFWYKKKYETDNKTNLDVSIQSKQMRLIFDEYDSNKFVNDLMKDANLFYAGRVEKWINDHSGANHG